VDNFGERLKQARTRLGMSQEEFGAVGGVKKVAQSNYETGKRFPDSQYLARLAEAGVDIQFVVSGFRLDIVSKPSDLPASESAPIDVAQLVRIAERLDATAKEAGKRLPLKTLVEIAADVYNYFQQEEGVQDDEKLNRTLKLVVNR